MSVTRVDRSALVEHSARRMFALVNDVPSYQRFLPWCSGSRILEERPGEVVAQLDVAKAGFKYSFSTRNRFTPDERIEVSLVEGPFRSLKGAWTFTPLGDNACKVRLELSFDFRGKLTGMAMSKVFNQIALAMVDAFCREADRLYGAPES